MSNLSTQLVQEEILNPNKQVLFSDFAIPQFIVQSLERGGITNPSPVQEKAIPIALEGRDILASAQTGTGKTIAFLLPIITQMLEQPESNAIILAPTRELATQVKDSIFKLVPKGNQIRSISLIGGESIMRQISQLKGLEEGAIIQRRPQRSGFNRNRVQEMPKGGNGIHKNVIFVGTPGRIKDLIDRGAITLAKAHFVVLDETDRMLDLGFKEVIEEIFSHIPEERQTLMFSATMPSKIISLSKHYLKNPARIDIEKAAENQPKIKQEIVKYLHSHKFKTLTDILAKKEGLSIIFTKTKMGAEELAAKLQSEGFEASAIHGDLRQRERDFVIRSIKTGKIRIMVATDVAARGLHISDVELVINYDLPGTKEDYTHRIGRTGRAGAEGLAISFVNENDHREMKVAKAYMKTEDDEDNEDVRAFSRDYSQRKKKNFGGNFYQRVEGRGNSFDERERRPSFGRDNKFSKDSRDNRRRNDEEREEGSRRSFWQMRKGKNN